MPRPSKLKRHCQQMAMACKKKLSNVQENGTVTKKDIISKPLIKKQTQVDQLQGKVDDGNLEVISEDRMEVSVVPLLVAEGNSSTVQILPPGSPYVTLCRRFLYQLDHFTRFQVPGDGNCLYSSLFHFIKKPQFAGAQEVRQSIDNFYKTCRSVVLKKYLGCCPADYARNKKIGVDGEWAEDTEILAAAILFQRPVYLFRRRPSLEQGYDIFEFSPMFSYKREWEVYGLPEYPIVLLCTEPTGYHFDALFLKGPASMQGPSFDSISPLKRLNRLKAAAAANISYIPDKNPLHDEVRLVPENRGLVAFLTGKIKSLEKGNTILVNENDSLKLQLLMQNKFAGLKGIDKSSQVTGMKGIDKPSQVSSVNLQPEPAAEVVIEPINLSQEAHKIRRHVDLVKGETIVTIRTDNAKHCKFYHYIPISRVAYQKTRGRQLISALDSVLNLAITKDIDNSKAIILMALLKRNKNVLKKFLKKAHNETTWLNFLKLTASQSLDLMYDLNLTGVQYRRLRKHLKRYNIDAFASEYAVMEERDRRNVLIQMREDTLQLREYKDGLISIVDRCCFRAPSIIGYVKEMYERTLKNNLMKTDERFGKEIWLAIGGDKGGTMTKIVFTFANSSKPNSFSNLHVLALYEGDDSEANLREVLSLYQSEWQELLSLKLPAPSTQASNGNVDGMDGTTSIGDDSLANNQAGREQEMWPVRIFLFGDMLFLAHMMGLAGASSTAPCIFCIVKNDELKKVKKDCFTKMKAAPRSLVQWDHALELGDSAMQRLGIKSQPILPIEIDNIFPPVLHLMLGLGTDLVTKIEEACYQRDLALGADVNANKEYKRLCKAVMEQTDVLEEIVLQREQADLILNHVTEGKTGQTKKGKAKGRGDCSALICFANCFEKNVTWIKCNGCEKHYHIECCVKLTMDVDSGKNKNKQWLCPHCDDEDDRSMTKEEIYQDALTLCAQLKSAEEQLKNDLQAIRQRRDDIYGVIKEKQGHAIGLLNDALSKLGVDRQAFVGNVLVGNHIRKLITGEGPRLVTECLDGDSEEEKEECQLFFEMLSILGRIVSLMCAPRFLDNEEIERLENACKHLGQVYEKFEYKDMTVTPKMHIIVHHVPEFVRRNRTVGLISEHGIEALHVRFNRIGRRYACLRSVAMKMRAMIKQHTTESSQWSRIRNEKE